IKADLLKSVADLAGQVGLHKFFSGDIDAHGEWRARRKLRLPRLQLLAGFAPQLPIHGDDEANLFSHGDELSRWNDALQPLPSRQGLEASDFAGLQRYDRLVENAEFSLLVGLAQIGL